MTATHMTTAVRTGGPGAKGVSVIVISLDLPGVSRRKIKNSGFQAGESTWVTLENVVVPVENLLGKENNGFPTLMTSTLSFTRIFLVSLLLFFFPADPQISTASALLWLSE